MLARHPGVVKTAQAEIDEAIGRERLPMITDRKSIPYIDCIMKEVFRYVIALGVSVFAAKTISV